MMSEDVKREYIRGMRNRTTRLDREGDYWEPYELEKLKYEFECGTDITEISLMLQRTEPAIMQQIEKLDLYERKKNPQRIRCVPQPSCLCAKCPLNQTCNRNHCAMEVSL